MKMAEIIVAATQNKHKIKEIDAITKEFGMEIISRNDAVFLYYDAPQSIWIPPMGGWNKITKQFFCRPANGTAYPLTSSSTVFLC